ncbi:MAG: flagellar biosynthesis anti-sigma factor FlgM [Candidatus Scalindua sp.]|nr:flagellar biosynthesis anti-sigma factor FlgM [Candidatus Scalindua sp.]
MPIESVSHVGHGLIDSIKGDNALKKNEGIKPVSGVSKEGHNLNVVDKVEISEEVQGLQNMLSKLKADLEKVPDVRPGKVEHARKRMESGFYDKQDVIAKVAGDIKKLTI